MDKSLLSADECGWIGAYDAVIGHWKYLKAMRGPSLTLSRMRAEAVFFLYTSVVSSILHPWPAVPFLAMGVQYDIVFSYYSRD